MVFAWFSHPTAPGIADKYHLVASEAGQSNRTCKLLGLSRPRRQPSTNARWWRSRFGRQKSCMTGRLVLLQTTRGRQPMKIA
jgi:hypothetical protein